MRSLSASSAMNILFFPDMKSNKVPNQICGKGYVIKIKCLLISKKFVGWYHLITIKAVKTNSGVYSAQTPTIPTLKANSRQ